MRQLMWIVPIMGAGAINADTFGSGANEFTMDFVTIRNAGNSADDTGYGAVEYDYRMGVHEVSRAMVDAYNALGGDPVIPLGDMTNYGANGPNRPATGPSWNAAARFVNWLNTSKGYPPAYNFTTANSSRDHITLWQTGDDGYDPNNPFRNSRAHYFLPSEDEWYKAAFYDPVEAAYFEYATGSNTPPTAVWGGTGAGSAVYSGTGAPGPADVTNAGSLSPFGTMAQSGNVSECLESAFASPNDLPTENRVRRGGSWLSPDLSLRASERIALSPRTGYLNVGFRVASGGLADSDHDGLPDVVETNTGIYVSPDNIGSDPNDTDSDDDGLQDGAEVTQHNSNPNLSDTDSDGFDDGFEVDTGFDPASATSTPDTLSSILTAVEFRFNAANGATYRVETSIDLENWTIIEDGIAGNGGEITRLYSTEGKAVRAFRARRN